ncbi:hypothetical protein EYF80_005295 [Liparis tanakae]|uniref:Uncharacterized protein n=1 Tax=Liparis tanakae TaxID=230148 RepID=A0A4Z2J2M3_9TELE|nr:hypothetical protein EYF80_005295 [Liparis tanakae]
MALPARELTADRGASFSRSPVFSQQHVTLSLRRVAETIKSPLRGGLDYVTLVITDRKQVEAATGRRLNLTFSSFLPTDPDGSGGDINILKVFVAAQFFSSRYFKVGKVT